MAQLYKEDIESQSEKFDDFLKIAQKSFRGVLDLETRLYCNSMITSPLHIFISSVSETGL